MGRKSHDFGFDCMELKGQWQFCHDLPKLLWNFLK